MKITAVLNNHPDRVRIAYGALYMLFALYAVIHITRLASLPTDENIFTDRQEGLTIIEITKGGASDLAGLKVGDIITRINGLSFKNAFQADSILRSGSVGKEIRYTIRREGKESIFNVRLAQAGLAIPYILLSSAGLLILGIGFVVVMLRPANPTARLLSISFLLLGMFFPITEGVRGSVYHDVIQHMQRYLSPLANTFGLATLAHLILYFPVSRLKERHPAWIFALIYGLPSLVLALGFLYPIKSPVYSGIVSIVTVFCLFFVPVIYAWGRFNPEYREKSLFIRITGYIFSAFVLFQVAANIWQFDPRIRYYIPVVFFSIPVLFGLTIVKYRVFDIYLVIRRTLIYTVLTWFVVVGAAVGFLLMINALPTLNLNLPAVHFTERTVELVSLNQLPEPERSQVEKSMLISFGVLGALLLWQGQHYGRQLLEKKFYRQKYDYRQAMREFATLSSRFSDRDALAREVVKKVSDIMHLKGAALAFVTNGSFHIRESLGLNQDCCRTISLKTNESWVRILHDMHTSQAVDNLGATSVFSGTGVQFLTPVVAHESLEGMILLGEKHSETNYTKDDIELLDSLSRQVASALETMRLYEEVHEKERMRKELEIARRIQLDSLPKETPSIPGLDIAAVSKPAMEVGGDFYDFLVRHNEVTFMLGDVSGKGTSAAIHMSRVQGIIRSLDSYQPSLWELFIRLNSQIYGQIERKSYVTVIGVRMNLLNYSTSFIRAGHLPLVHYHADANSIEVYQPMGLGVGLDERQFSHSLVEQTITPRLGDVILLFSDGLSEAQDTRHEEYGISALQHVLLQNAHRSAGEIQEAIMDSVLRFVDGALQHDDITCVVIKLV